MDSWKFEYTTFSFLRVWDTDHNEVSEVLTVESQNLGGHQTLKHWPVKEKEFLKHRSWQLAELGHIIFPVVCAWDTWGSNRSPTGKSFQYGVSLFSRFQDIIWKFTFVIFSSGKRIMSFCIPSNWMPNAGVKLTGIWNRILFLGTKVNSQG